MSQKTAAEPVVKEVAQKMSAADRMLASIRRGADMPAEALHKLGVEPSRQESAKPESKPEPRVEEEQGEESPREMRITKSNSNGNANRKPKRSVHLSPAAVQRQIDFDVSTGRGVKSLTIRVPKDLAADLALLAMRNKLSENGEPTTINELGLKAFRDLIDAADAA